LSLVAGALGLLTALFACSPSSNCEDLGTCGPYPRDAGPVCAGECLPPAPAGWQGPIEIARRPYATTQAPDCDPGWSKPTDYVGELKYSDAMCTCDCGGGGCVADATLDTYIGSCMGAPMQTVMMKTDGTCAAVAVSMNAYYKATWDPTPTACMPSGKTTLPDPTGNRLLACSATPTKDCENPNEVCAPNVRNGVSVCIYKTGDKQACPADYSKAEAAYSKYDDSRACEMCSCTANPGDCGAAKVSLHTDAACLQAGENGALGACQKAGSSYPSADLALGAGPGCHATAGTKPTADKPTPQDPLTVCCR
jgi:hypothetical protein